MSGPKMGYMFTSNLAHAHEMYDDDLVRYVAELDDESAIVAYDSHFTMVRECVSCEFYNVEPHPDYPPSWPWQNPQKPAPKRFISNGRERFATGDYGMARNWLDDVESNSHMTGFIVLDDDLVLAEFDLWVPTRCLWTAAAVNIWDKRLADGPIITRSAIVSAR